MRAAGRGLSCRLYLQLSISAKLHGQPIQQRRDTLAEYFAIEAGSKEHHECFDGKIFAMAGGTKSHRLIAQNLTLALRGSLQGQSSQVLMEDVRLVV